VLPYVPAAGEKVGVAAADRDEYVNVAKIRLVDEGAFVLAPNPKYAVVPSTQDGIFTFGHE
jgi:hypothetical protein